jgi:aminoglycoside phosphotransferase
MKTNTIENEFNIKVIKENIVALEIDNIEEDLIIVAYGDAIIPSLILQNQTTKEFSHIKFEEFPGFKVWSADLNYDTLKICLVK